MTAFELMATISLDDSKFVSGLYNAEGKATGFAGKAGGALKKLGKFAGVALGAASAAVTAFGVSSVKTGMEFDKAMSQVYATMGDKADAMITDVNGTTRKASEVLRDFAQEMGATTQYTASESAQALNYMALAGYDAATSMEMLPNVMNLASAGAFDLAKASDMLTDTQTALGWNLERTKQAVDEWAKAASTGNTSVEQLGDAFLTVGGLARELNGGFIKLADGTKASVDGTQELEIALTAMANAGVKGSEAGTHMRNMLLKLSSPTAEGTKQLEAMGVAVFDNEGKMRSLSDIFGDLNGKLGEMTQQDKIQAISDLFNTRDLASAEALLNAVGEDWDKIGASILDSKGAAEKMKETQLDNLAGDITYFKSALDGAKIALSDGLSPALRKFVQAGTDGLTKFTEKLKSGDFVGAAETIGESLGNIATQVVSKLPQLLSSGLSLIKGLATGISAELPNVLSQVSSQLLEMMGEMATSIGEKFPTMLQSALTNLVGITENIRNMAGSFVDAGLSIVQSIAQGIIQNIPTIIQTVPTIISNIAGIINDNAPKLISTGLQIIVSLVQGIISAIPVIVANLPKIVAAIWDVFTAVNWLALGGQLITAIGNGMKAFAKSLPSTLKSIATRAMNAFKGVSWASVGRTALTLIGRGISALASLPFRLLRSAASSAMRAFTGIAWGSVGSNVVRGIARGITAGVSLVVNAARNAAKRAFQAAKNFLGIQSPSKLFRDKIGKNIALGMALGIDDGERNVSTAMNRLNSSLISATPTASVIGSSVRSGVAANSGDVFNFNMAYDAGNDANDLLRDFARGVQRYRMAGAI